MCARYVLAAAEKQILEAYAAEIKEGWLPHYNIAPTIESLVITADEPLLIQKMHFGLVAHHAKSTRLDYDTWNARSEEVMTKNTYRPLMIHHKRCLVLASGFYESKKVTETFKPPYYFQVKDRPLFSFAGLWSRWEHPETKIPYYSYTIMTTEANETVAEIHYEKKRMPVILDKTQEAVWLSKDVDNNQLLQICDTYPDELMTRHRVNIRANNVDRKTKPNNDPGLIEPFENSL
jgi:putative SOS response-associated peptidase YedK